MDLIGSLLSFVQYNDNFFFCYLLFLDICFTVSSLFTCSFLIIEDLRLGKLAKPRQLHNSQWGMMCPAETPEGQVSIVG